MLHARGRILAIVTALALGLVGSACKKEGKGGAGGGGGGGSAKVSGAAASAMGTFPKDTQIIGGISFEKMRKVKGWDPKQITTMLEMQQPEFAAMQKTCGINFLNELDSIVVGANIPSKKIIILVKGKFDEAKVTKCVTAMGQEKGKTIEAKKDGKLTFYGEKDSTDGVYAAWVAGDTVMIAPHDSKDFLVAGMEGKDSIKGNAVLQDLIGKANSGGVMWGAGQIPKEMADELAKMANIPAPSGGFGYMDAKSGLELKVGLAFADDAGAKQAADVLGKMVEQYKGMLAAQMPDIANAVKVAQSGKDAVLSLSLTEKQVEDLSKQMSGMGM